MKPEYTSSFARGQKIVRYLLGLSIAAALIGFFLYTENSTGQILCIVTSLAAMIALIVVIVRDCRCPGCGRRIIGGVLVTTVCPACKRNLYTGEKLKKARKK